MTMSELEGLFNELTTLVRETPVTKELQTTTTDDKLRLYGLYKHVTAGECQTDQKPSVFAVEAYAKYNAWNECRSMSKDSAMLAYVKISSKQEHWLGIKCLKLFDAYRKTTGTDDNKVSSSVQKDQEDSVSCDRNMLLKDSFFHRWLGFAPLAPRGQLDISNRDLWFALGQCVFGSGTVPQCRRYEDEIGRLWRHATGRESMVALSVRSLLDLFLLARQYPKGSQIILAPAINVPGMIHVLRYHQLEVVSVDLPQNEQGESVVGVDCEAVAKAVTSKTVAVLVTHPFGIICAGETDMRRLKVLCLDKKLDLVEDCAECYTGLGNGCYVGSPHADLSLFSFGLIKTATALGGGIAIAGLSELLTSMRRQTGALYKEQSRLEYLQKVLTAFVFRMLCEIPILYTLVYLSLQALGFHFDTVVSQCLRSFPVPKDDDPSVDLISLSRKRPSAMLLSLLHRQFNSSRSECPSVKRRLRQCESFLSLCPQLPPAVSQNARRTHWLFPILCPEPQRFCAYARGHGFDVTQGSTQLVCAGTARDCPRTTSMMQQIVYLPIASRNISQAVQRKLQVLLHTNLQQECSNGKPQTARRATLLLRYLLVPVLAVAWYVTFASWIRLFLFSMQFSLIAMATAALGCYFTQRVMSDFYLSSTAFSQFNRLVSTTGRDSRKAQSMLKENDEILGGKTIVSPMEALCPLPGSSEQLKSVIVTGSTGFIGSALLRDLLYHRERLGIENILLICRPKRNVSPKSRIEGLLEDKMFSFLTAEEKSKYVTVVPGDVTMKNAGIEPGLFERIKSDQSVTHVFHCAAAVSFTLSLEDAAQVNVSSALNVQALTGCLANEAARFIHISTAFVHGDRTGTPSQPLDQDLSSLERFDAKVIYQSMQGTQFYAATAMRDLGFFNSYTFSKCVCEHLLSLSRVDTVIIRPSIVGPALENPYEGWAGKKPSTIVAAACLYLIYQWNLWFFGPHVVPCIPVDVLSRFIVRHGFSSEGNVRICDEASSEDDFERVSEPEVYSMSAESDSSSSAPLYSPPDLRRPDFCKPTIVNAAWDASSPRKAQFTWVEYAVAVTQLGSVMGNFLRPVAYVGLFFTTRLLPMLQLSASQFEWLHSAFVIYPFKLMLLLRRAAGYKSGKMERLESFLDLPLLFFPFMTRDFYFSSELVAPSDMDGTRYLFSSAVAAHRFVETAKENPGKNERSRSPPRTSLSTYRVAGRLGDSRPPSFLWAMTQPVGGPMVRVIAWIVAKVLHAVFHEVTVDVESFSLQLDSHYRKRIVLAPSHRSFFDFVLLSYVFFCIPELHVDIPYIAAAEEFSRVPLIGWLVQMGRAFFVVRHRGRSDPTLVETVRRVSQSPGVPVIEVFIEGRRSRDRRFVVPKTGFLKCLKETDENATLVVPVTINYERIPEQSQLAAEASGSRPSRMTLTALFRWLTVSVDVKMRQSPRMKLNIFAIVSGLLSGKNLSRASPCFGRRSESAFSVSN
jgi:nucleoside-diphosphate-sugar epimerase/acyl-CoA-binding protein